MTGHERIESRLRVLDLQWETTGDHVSEERLAEISGGESPTPMESAHLASCDECAELLMVLGAGLEALALEMPEAAARLAAPTLEAVASAPETRAPETLAPEIAAPPITSLERGRVLLFRRPLMLASLAAFVAAGAMAAWWVAHTTGDKPATMAQKAAPLASGERSAAQPQPIGVPAVSPEAQEVRPSVVTPPVVVAETERAPDPAALEVMVPVEPPAEVAQPVEVHARVAAETPAEAAAEVEAPTEVAAEPPAPEVQPRRARKRKASARRKHDPAAGQVRISGEGLIDGRSSRAAPSAPVAGPPRGVGFLRLSAKPPARVFIDGKPRGWTPLINLALPEGAHDVRLVYDSPLADTREERFRVMIPADKVWTTVRRNLKAAP